MVQPCFNLAHGDVSETGKIVAKQLDENIQRGKLSDRLAMPCIVRISHIAATFDGPRHTDERPEDRARCQCSRDVPCRHTARSSGSARRGLNASANECLNSHRRGNSLNVVRGIISRFLHDHRYHNTCYRC